MSDRIDRITRMEAVLNDSAAAAEALSAALDAYEALLPQMQALEAYYTGPQWLDDHDADAKGLIPQDLRRGVLTEDAVYDLLIDLDGIRRRMAQLGGKENGHAERHS